MEVDLLHAVSRLACLLALGEILESIFVAPGLHKAEVSQLCRILVSNLVLEVNLKAIGAVL